jgi:hypothetical protein
MPGYTSRDLAAEKAQFSPVKNAVLDKKPVSVIN